MIAVEAPADFDTWRKTARNLLADSVAPANVSWCMEGQQSLFRMAAVSDDAAHVKVSKDFVKLARLVGCHTSSERWELLYRVLWRLTHGDPELLKLASDPDVRACQLLGKAVARDIHKMHAFVRFKVLKDEQGAEQYVAWYKPEHHILRLAAPFFMRRFGSMSWAIATPFGSVYWDQETLHFGGNTNHAFDRPSDDFEQLWRKYYRSTFHPAEQQTKLMTRELPRRFWNELPEADAIRELLKDSGKRVKKSTKQQVPAARIELKDSEVAQIREQLPSCRACPLFASATQVVRGEGPKDADLVFVGEQPGDEEDRTGRPLAGPAGKKLNRALHAAGIDRSHIYLTNAVKHFKFDVRGQARRSKRASGEEMRICGQWLEAELNAIKPKLIVALGSRAAQSVLGRTVRIGEERGRLLRSAFGPVLVTYHPSALLRAGSERHRRELFSDFVCDLSAARAFATQIVTEITQSAQRSAAG